MIFLFFTSSLGPLEPELATFKDFEEIGIIWKISLKVALAHWFLTYFQLISDFPLISEMSPFSCKSLNRANSGSRGPREEVK